MNELALFAGAGGGILGGKILGWRTVCACELDEYARAVLIARQNDGTLPPFPIWDDVRTFDGKPWRRVVDIVTGGFPCQDISVAGTGKGLDGERSGLWTEMARIIREVGPRYVLVENSPVLTSRGLGRVVGDLAAMGYDARWGVLGAVHAGAPHKRERIWIWCELADARCERQPAGRAGSRETADGEILDLRTSDRREDVANAYGMRELRPQGREREERRWTGDSRSPVQDTECERWGEVVEPNASGTRSERTTSETMSSDERWWDTEPDVGRVAHGVAARVDRLRCLGNGQVPAVVALAWETLTRDL